MQEIDCFASLKAKIGEIPRNENIEFLICLL